MATQVRKRFSRTLLSARIQVCPYCHGAKRPRIHLSVSAASDPIHLRAVQWGSQAPSPDLRLHLVPTPLDDLRTSSTMHIDHGSLLHAHVRKAEIAGSCVGSIVLGSDRMHHQ